jgi:hypothetical protein
LADIDGLEKVKMKGSGRPSISLNNGQTIKAYIFAYREKNEYMSFKMAVYTIKSKYESAWY